MLVYLQNLILEMVARGEELPATADRLCREVERLTPGSVCSILCHGRIHACQVRLPRCPPLRPSIRASATTCVPSSSMMEPQTQYSEKQLLKRENGHCADLCSSVPASTSLRGSMQSSSCPPTASTSRRGTKPPISNNRKFFSVCRSKIGCSTGRRHRMLTLKIEYSLGSL